MKRPCCRRADRAPGPGLGRWDLLWRRDLTGRFVPHFGVPTLHERVAAAVGVRAGDGVRAVAAERTVAHRQPPFVTENAAADVPESDVAGYFAVAHSRRSEIDEAAAVVGGVAGDGAVADRHVPDAAIDRQRPGVVNAAAAVDGGVVRHGTAADGRRAVVVDAPAVAGRVVGDLGAADRQRAEVVDPAPK